MNFNKNERQNKNNKRNNNNLTADVENNNENVDENYEGDDRLIFTLISLGLDDLISTFLSNHISFVDMLLLSKEDLIELELQIFQRNRILNFSKTFSKFASAFSLAELTDFFGSNKKFLFNAIAYETVIQERERRWDEGDKVGNIRVDKRDKIESEGFFQNYDAGNNGNNDEINVWNNCILSDISDITHKKSKGTKDNCQTNHKIYTSFNKSNTEASKHVSNFNKTNPKIECKSPYFKPSTASGVNSRIKTKKNTCFFNTKIESYTAKNNSRNDLEIRARNMKTSGRKTMKNSDNNDKKAENDVKENSEGYNVNVDNSAYKLNPLSRPHKYPFNSFASPKSLANNLFLSQSSNIFINSYSGSELTPLIKKTYNAKKAYETYKSIKKEADDFLARISKQKNERGELQNKYQSLIKKTGVRGFVAEEGGRNYCCGKCDLENDWSGWDEMCGRNFGGRNGFNHNSNLSNILSKSSYIKASSLSNNNNSEASNYNKEYEKLLKTIEEIGLLNLDSTSTDNLNKIKQFVNIKGDDISLAEILKLNKDLTRVKLILRKKAELKKKLSKCNENIYWKKRMIDTLEGGSGCFEKNVGDFGDDGVRGSCEVVDYYNDVGYCYSADYYVVPYY